MQKHLYSQNEEKKTKKWARGDAAVSSPAHRVEKWSRSMEGARGSRRLFVIPRSSQAGCVPRNRATSGSQSMISDISGRLARDRHSAFGMTRPSTWGGSRSCSTGYGLPHWTVMALPPSQPNILAAGISISRESYLCLSSLERTPTVTAIIPLQACRYQTTRSGRSA